MGFQPQLVPHSSPAVLAAIGARQPSAVKPPVASSTSTTSPSNTPVSSSTRPPATKLSSSNSKLPLLAQAIREQPVDAAHRVGLKLPAPSTTTTATPSSAPGDNATKSTIFTPTSMPSSNFSKCTAIDRSEMLQKLKTEIFKNLHKQPSEIFSKTKRAGSPIKNDLPNRKRSKSDQDGTAQARQAAKPEAKITSRKTIDPVCPGRETPEPKREAEIKTEPDLPPTPSVENSDSDSPDEAAEKRKRKRPGRTKKVALTKSQEIATLINRRALPKSTYLSYPIV